MGKEHHTTEQLDDMLMVKKWMVKALQELNWAFLSNSRDLPHPKVDWLIAQLKAEAGE